MVKKSVKKKEGLSEFKKNFVWKGFRIGFWLMIATLILSIAVSLIGFYLDNPLEFLNGVISLIFTLSVGFTFVMSVIHLIKYKERSLAITAFVISFILILLQVFTFGVMVGVLSSDVLSQLPQ